VGIYPDLIKGALFSQYPIVKDYVLVLFKKSKLNQWNGSESLQNKKVAWIQGYAYDEYLEETAANDLLGFALTIIKLLNA
jgi:hypothetical protein